jgi:hypothetical protein
VGPNGEKTGGRAKGTPNKATQQVKQFLEGVFEEAFANEQFRRLLLDRIVTLQIDNRLLTTLLHYYAGRPAVAVDHTLDGTVSLAQIIAGDLPTALEPDEGGDDG